VRRIYFWSYLYLKSRLFRAIRGARTFGLDAGRISQAIEKEQTFMVKGLLIKWNLMAEFFPLLGRAKVR
jgi:hypothetical protein